VAESASAARGAKVARAFLAAGLLLALGAAARALDPLAAELLREELRLLAEESRKRAAEAEEERRIAAEPDPPGSFLARKKKFRPDGRLRTLRLGDMDLSYEEGTAAGVPYRFFHIDGSAWFGALSDPAEPPPGKSEAVWEVRCHLSRLPQRRWCRARKDDLHVALSEEGELTVTVGSNPSPDSKLLLRVGEEAPEVASGGWSGEEARRLLNRLLAAEKVTTIYRSLDRARVERETRLFGLGQVLEYLRFAVAPAAREGAAGPR
jgi:hypothetical protein